MRRWAAILAGALALALALASAGCTGLPRGVDGDLTGSWQPMPTAQQFRPAAGSCHADLSSSGALRDYAPIPCAGPHLAETVAVAELTDPGILKPEAGMSRAYAECSRQATAFLGADWRTGWVVVQPVLPGGPAWDSGARWVRCDIAENSPVDGSTVRRDGSMKGGLRPGGKLLITCANSKIENQRVAEMRPVTCATKHTSEFAGLFETKVKSSADLTSRELEKGCGATIAKFAGLKNDGTVENRVGWLAFPPDDTAWGLGDRAVRCFLWLDGEKMTGSYRNAGPRKLKINYAN